MDLQAWENQVWRSFYRKGELDLKVDFKFKRERINYIWNPGNS